MKSTTTTTSILDDMVYYTVKSMKTQLNKNGEEKKAFYPPNKWEELTKEMMNESYKDKYGLVKWVDKKHKVRCILTGKVNNITVYDFDNLETYERMTTEHPELEKCFKVKTRKGYHIYFNYNEKAKQTTNAFDEYEGIDIRNDGGMVFAPPTTYNLLDKTECKYELIGGELIDVPDYLIDNLKSVKAEKSRNEKQTKINIKEVLQDKIKYESTDKDFDKIKLGIENGLLNKKASVNDGTFGESYDDWRDVGLALYTSFDSKGYELFKMFSELNKKKYDEAYTKSTWKSFKPTDKSNKIGLGSLFFFMKEKDETLYNELFYKKKYKDETEREVDELCKSILKEPTDFLFAKLFVKLYGKFFKCEDIDKKKVWYFNENNIWIEEGTTPIRLKLSNEISKELKKRLEEVEKDYELEQDEKRKEQLKKLLIGYKANIVKLQNTCNKNNITREIMDEILDTKFSENMNKQYYLLPLKNKKVLDLRTMEVNERTIEHKFSYECNFDIVELKEEDKTYANEYYSSLFCDNETTKQAFLDLIKTALTGKPMRNINFFLGSGSNGKSLLFKVLKTGLTCAAMDTISKDVILKKKSNSHLNTELEKTEKCRVGIFSELSEDDKLNEKTIKEITGDDGIDLRAIQKTNRTIEPTSTLFIITNEMPDFKSEKAINKRLVMFPMNNVFQTNTKIKDELLGKLDILFTYLLQNGNIVDELTMSEEMVYLTKNTIDDNEKDYLKEFITERITILTEQAHHTKIKRDDFIQSYYEYCSRKQYYIKKLTVNKFSRIMNERFGITIDKNAKYELITWKIEEE
jgi:P4 family phage/plasmid primase-like protien